MVCSLSEIDAKDSYLCMPGGVRLHSRAYYPKSDIVGGVLVLHGFGGCMGNSPILQEYDVMCNEDLLATGLARHGFYALMFNQRAHGDSEGQFTMGKTLEDTLFIAENYMAEYRGNLYATGCSLGGYISLVSAGTANLFRKIAPVNAPLCFQDIIPSWFSAFYQKSRNAPGRDAFYRMLFAFVNLAFIYAPRGYKGMSLKKLFTSFNECRIDSIELMMDDFLSAPSVYDKKIECGVGAYIGELDYVVKKKGQSGLDEYINKLSKSCENIEINVMEGLDHSVRTRDGKLGLESDEIIKDIAGFFKR